MGRQRVQRLHLNPTTLALGTFITLDYWGGQPYAIDFSPDGVQAFVTSPATGTVFIIERPAPNTYYINPVVLGGAPQRIAFGENGAAALITNEQNWVDIIR